MQQIIFFTLLIATSIAAVYAIKCYACESVYESNCAEDFELENHFKLDCSYIAPPRFLDNDLSIANATACMKREFRENGVKKYMRSCFFGDVNDTDVGCRMDPSLTGIQNVSCHVCYNENFCNTADQINRQPNIWKILTCITFILTARIIKIV